ncbi:MAG: hypothetical protein QE487_12265 [Fluviicola sp.]|nr:hypothetical protein [Fluviicola sp.]
MRYLLLALIAFTSKLSFGQQPDTVFWSNTAITTSVWPKPDETKQPAQFIAYLDVRLKKDRLDKTIHVHYSVNAKWLRNESFIVDSVKDRYLPLAQLFFDCYELESRKLQERLNTSEALMDLEIPESNKRVNDQIEGLREITNNGFDTLEMRFWRSWMDSSLLATPRTFLPNFESEKWEFGFDIGAGVSMLNGDLSNYFQTLPAFGYEASLGIKRVQFDYSALHSFAKSDLAFAIGDFKFTDSSRLQLNQSGWTIGYQCIKRYKWTVTPYGGLSTFRIINRDEPKGSLYAKGRASYNWEAGVITEWRFLHFYQGNNAQFFWKLRLKVGYAPIYYLYKVRGDAVKIQLGIGFTMKSVRNLPSE